MGDRGNIVVDGVYLYSHWGGSGLKKVLSSALKRSTDRWSDGQYLCRIIFCEMMSELGGDDVLEDKTGFGISAQMCDNGNPLLVVDTHAQTVTEERSVPRTWSFEDFIEIDFDEEEEEGEDE